MQLTRRNGAFVLSAKNYTLTFAHDRPFVYLSGPQGRRLAEIFVLSSVHPLHGRDDTTSVGTWQVTETPQEIVFTLSAESSVWNSKTYRFRCQPNRLLYDIEVAGQGRLAEANYFGGYYSGQIRWGSGFFWSGQHFRQGFNPEPNTAEINHFYPENGVSIDLTGVPLPGRGSWFFTPPPFCFAFQIGNDWLGLGVEAGSGEKRFTEFSYHGRIEGFYLSLSYEGHTTVNDAYRLPAIGIDFGTDELDVLSSHVRVLSEGVVLEEHHSARPAWWQEPIFCGWGAQCFLAAKDDQGLPSPTLSEQKHQAQAYATQANYEAFLDKLGQNGIAPGTITIDDKWQAGYGDNRVDEKKWRDLPGFVKRQHAAGRRVLLWLKAWDREDVPPDECITNARGLPLTVDPTNPAYERRLRASVRRMLSADGYDADGFKIDFSARIPSGPGICTFGDVWGLELMKLLLRIIYEEAKATKPDALIITHTAHPYLADVLDMIRLNDANVGKNIVGAMTHRARIAAIACPGALIDTDNWPITDKATWREYLLAQPRLGVPSLYFSHGIDSTLEPFNGDDYRLIRETWARYRLKLAQNQEEAIKSP
ncbi:MAG: hypothetical protein ACM3JD_19625 [Rudaea sp.]